MIHNICVGQLRKISPNANIFSSYFKLYKIVNQVKKNLSNLIFTKIKYLNQY